MLRYIARRLLLTIPTIIAISIVSFAIIQLPPGDFLTSLVANMVAGQGRQPAQQSDESYLVRCIDYENLVRWSPDWESVEPNVAESWEVSAFVDVAEGL